MSSDLPRMAQLSEKKANSDPDLSLWPCALAHQARQGRERLSPGAGGILRQFKGRVDITGTWRHQFPFPLLTEW